MLSEEIRDIINELVAADGEHIKGIAKHIWSAPETGYREYKTSEYLASEFEALGYDVVRMNNIPGFYADLDTKRTGPTLAILAELDSILCEGHPERDVNTNAVHACGHHTQCGYLVGVAGILRDSRIFKDLCGKVRFVAVPAEELIELEYRESLRKKGDIKYFGGKVEFLYRGIFDGVDAALMVHSGCHIEDDKSLSIYKGNNGCLTKTVTYTGKAAHAAGGPHEAINALYAATLGIQAINSIRETFTEKNFTRVHPIITQGGAAVNVIPEKVRLETYVRGSSPNAIVSENKKVNRALAGAAVSIGARVSVDDIPGYMPLTNEMELNLMAETVSDIMLGTGNIEVSDNWSAGSTDMGDLCCVMPVVHLTGGGGEGIGHGENFNVKDYNKACLDSTRFVTGMVYTLLSEDGNELIRVKENFIPEFSGYKEYFDFVDNLLCSKDLVIYEENSASVSW